MNCSQVQYKNHFNVGHYKVQKGSSTTIRLPWLSLSTPAMPPAIEAFHNRKPVLICYWKVMSIEAEQQEWDILLRESVSTRYYLTGRKAQGSRLQNQTSLFHRHMTY